MFHPSVDTRIHRHDVRVVLRGFLHADANQRWAREKFIYSAWMLGDEGGRGRRLKVEALEKKRPPVSPANPP